MKEITGDLWDFHNAGFPIVITTNGAINSRGECVMGRGVASQAKNRYPTLPLLLGNKIRAGGNNVYFFNDALTKIFSFPVKHHWAETADPELIIRSATQLMEWVDSLAEMTTVTPNIYLPRPGCGNGGLKWENVKPLLKCLDDRFTIVERHP